MKSLRRKLPPLTALTVFEAASRHLSFTKAAEELGVTQAAVSRQIHALEQDFGFPLFVRTHRKVSLTERGKALAASTSEAFNLIADTVATISKERLDDELTIAATVAFSQFWLLPRIAEFTRQHPDIHLRIVTQDGLPNFQTGDLDLAIRFGNGVLPDSHAEILFEDEVFPVCSPDFQATAGPILAPEDLLSHPLISNDAEDPLWTGWNEWLSACAVVVPKRPLGLRLSFYTEAIHAALNGQGIALGWKSLVADLLNQGRLIRLTDAHVKPTGAYCVVRPMRQSQKAATAAFLQWLRISVRP